jgi:hypothetical protein
MMEYGATAHNRSVEASGPKNPSASAATAWSVRCALFLRQTSVTFSRPCVCCASVYPGRQTWCIVPRWLRSPCCKRELTLAIPAGAGCLILKPIRGAGLCAARCLRQCAAPGTKQNVAVWGCNSVLRYRKPLACKGLLGAKARHFDRMLYA